MEIKIYKSQKGKPKIAHLGYSYRMSNVNLTTQNWRCSIAKCKGSLSTPINYEGNNVAAIVCRPHNHAPEPETVEAAVAKHHLKETAVSTQLAPRRIISETEFGMSDGGLSRLGKRKALSQTVHRARRRYLGQGREVALPRSRRFEVPEKYRTVTEGGREVNFLLYDSLTNEVEDEEEDEEEENRFLIFASETMILWLRQSNEWMIDATFKIVPRLFFQVLIVHGIYHGHVLPCAYVIMPNKTEASYAHVFAVLRDAIGEEVVPNIVVTDFEMALQKADLSSWPGTSVQGCFFHFCQGIWRKTQELGLARSYVTNEEVRNSVKRLSALAFLPVNEVGGSFDNLLASVLEGDGRQGLAQLYSYFENTFVGRKPARGPRTRPRFAIPMWNVRRRTEEGIPRTNNRLEGFHRGIQSMFDGPHPSMWKFLAGLQREQVLQYTNFIQISTGNDVTVEGRKYEQVNRRLRTLIERHSIGEVTTVAFLEGVAHNLNLSV